MPIPYTPPPASNGLDIRYQDDALVVLNKPSGLLSVPGRGADKQDCLWLRVKAEFPTALVVHRLDMATSGLIAMALNPAMQAMLGRLFEQRAITKRYVAMAAGRFEESEGAISLPLIADWPNRPRQKVDHALGKPALTHYAVTQHDPVRNVSRVELRPVTGRSHQLRVHLQALGHPILGDELYAPPAVHAASPRLLLHAAELAFIHPATGRNLQIHCQESF